MKNNNILFIVPPLLSIEEISDINNTNWATNCSIPLGLLSISSYISARDEVQISILDLNIEISKEEDKIKLIQWSRYLNDMFKSLQLVPDIVGISAIFNSSIGHLGTISQIVSELWPDALIVAGGGGASNLCSHVLCSFLAIDAVAVGEAERPFYDLLCAEDRRKYLNTATSWITKERVIRAESFKPDFIYNLDEIPFLDLSLIDFNQYQKMNRYHGEHEGDGNIASVMTSRGCPYSCNFCASHSVHGKMIRYHTPERVLADIDILVTKYAVTTVLIEDDNFLVNKKCALKILNGISEKKLTIEFPNGLSIMHLDEEIVDALNAAGMKMATLAIESGCERVLNEIIHKPYKSLSVVKTAINLLREKGIYIRAFFIIGFPGETKEELMESVNFMKNAGLNWVAIMIATPIAGSELYEYCRNNNLLATEKLDNFHYGKCNIKLPDFTTEEIEELRYQINLEVNFVDNFDLNNGHPETALIGFNDVINRVNDHAFAYYFAAICHKEMGKTSLYREHLSRYFSILESSFEWRKHAKKFGLPMKN